ncbi:TetR/AcrR family transcriptional regulator [Streptomyces sp. F63]|uniref:TetR/AcrR family transcriptional regulator n=1 Tax=Streptomyces sp. F63 TaxID=2824887 RepID=UPI001B391A98|nr:TetR/AcrR family transcriptional regulator [Streptomyces sp. F63]MBQ0984698.1 TetR/AcrR family transcriptional regulator [Streptomyces sp. F63]
MKQTGRLTGVDRREQVLKIAAEEFAAHGLHGVSAEAIARKAGITHAYVFRLFGTKKQLFIEVVRRAFESMARDLAEAAGPAKGLEALAAMGRRYDAGLSDRTLLLLQLQAFAACGDAELRAAVRESFGALWRTVSGITGLDAVQVKTFMAYAMLLNTSAALELADLDADWAAQAVTRIHAGLFEHLTTEVNE